MSEIYVCDASLLTPLGAIPAMIRAAVDAGLNSYQLCNLPGTEEQKLTFSAVPDAAFDVRIPQLLPGMSPPQIRLLKLASFSLLDLKPRLPDLSLPLFLAGPESYYQGCGVNQAFINNLVKTTGVELDYTHSRYCAKGRAGFMEALDAAFNYFYTTGADYALIGGIDSFYDLRTLGILHEQKRLASEDTGDGFVPGEAAAFLLVASAHTKQRLQKRPLLKLHKPALAHESGHLLGNLPYRAQALAPAMSNALKNVAGSVSRIFSSENGESHYTSETSLAVLRNQQRLIPDCPIYRPAECFGDLGAAFPLAAIALASVDIHTRNGNTLVTASSDGGLRGAVVLSAC
ncbi:MAG: hypothetical protein B0W54_13105 [Cellvibrio sp. 79]|nr:MAG: hypothetical protein B0W54_13105 [Cellvibrio sp. 79]